MASVVFLTLYDEFCLGVRQLVADLREAGHDARLICLKHYGKQLLADGEEAKVEWQIEVMPNGSRSVLCYPAAISAREKELLEDLLKKLRPDIVGLSVYSPQIERAAEVTNWARAAVPDSLVFWGGPHATLNPDESAEYCDYVLVGEGDVAMIEVCNAIDAKKPLGGIDSLTYRAKDGTIVKNPLAPLVQDLDTLPYAYHGEEGIYYLDFNELTEGVPFPDSDLRRTHKIMTSRGCPYACTYCMLSYQKEVMPESTKLRYRSIQHVIGELEFMKRKMGSYFLEIEDDIFTLRPERMEDFFDEYNARVAMPFWCYTHPQYARDEMLRLLRDNNAQFVVMGIESGSDRIANDVFNRKVKMKTVVEAAQRIRDAGLRGYYDLISNNPFETEEDRIETFHLVRSLPKPYEFQLVELNFYPNIKIDKMRKERGLSKKVDLQQYRYWNALYHLASAIDISDVDAEHYLKEQAFRDNPGLLERLAGEAKRLAKELADAKVWNRNYEREIQRLANRQHQTEQQLGDLQRRKGFRQFVWLSDRFRNWKRQLKDQVNASRNGSALETVNGNGNGHSGTNGNGHDLANGKTNGNGHGNSHAHSHGNGGCCNGHDHSHEANGNGASNFPGQYDIVTEVMAPLDYRPPTTGDRSSR